jgi:hypothetical protein
MRHRVSREKDWPLSFKGTIQLILLFIILAQVLMGWYLKGTSISREELKSFFLQAQREQEDSLEKVFQSSIDELESRYNQILNARMGGIESRLNMLSDLVVTDSKSPKIMEGDTYSIWNKQLE